MPTNTQRSKPGQDHEPAKVPPACPAARRYRKKVAKKQEGI